MNRDLIHEYVCFKIHGGRFEDLSPELQKVITETVDTSEKRREVDEG